MPFDIFFRKKHQFFKIIWKNISTEDFGQRNSKFLQHKIIHTCLLWKHFSQKCLFSFKSYSERIKIEGFSSSGGIVHTVPFWQFLQKMLIFRNLLQKISPVPKQMTFHERKLVSWELLVKSCRIFTWKSYIAYSLYATFATLFKVSKL